MMPVEQETSYFDYIAQLDWAGLQREEQLIRSKIKLVQIMIDMHYCERINNSTADIDANWEYCHLAVTASDICQGIVRFPRKSSFAVKTHKKQIHVDCGNGKEKRIINNSGRICGLKEYFRKHEVAPGDVIAARYSDYLSVLELLDVEHS